MIDRDSVPSTVESAAHQLAESLTDEDRERIRSGEETDHFGTGLSVRNDWSLWEPDSPLKRDAVATYGIANADDISGLIRAWANAMVRGFEFDPAAHCQTYRNHRARYETDPLTAGGWEKGT